MAADTNTENAAEDLGYNADAPAEGEAVQGLQEEEGDGFSFNMKNEEASSGYPLIPQNTYDAVCETCEFKISQNSGNPMWQVKWAINVMMPDKAGGEGAMKEKVMKITSFVVFSAENRGRAKMFVKRVAPELAELEDFDPRALASQISGKAARLKINHQPGQDGEKRSNVADVLAPQAGAGGGFGGL